jgi:superfamily II DNA or RNA helicase/HKD family nuclease
VELPAGRYDRVLDAGLERVLAAGLIGHLEDIDAADVPHRLAGHVAQAIRARLPDISAEEQAVLVADLLAILGTPDRLLAGEKPQRLVAVSPRAGMDPPVAPDIPLSEHDLLVNARGEPHLAAELKKELASADAVDLIVAFVRWTGIRLVLDELEDAIRRGVGVRLLTTTYTGSTEQRALDELAERGVGIRVSYDTQTTRLHAKSWQFHRASGYGTAYVGSSNLTRSALVDGREWNVRLSQDASPALFDKLGTAFEAQWASGDYEPYDTERFEAALRQARPLELAADVDRLSGLEIRPWPYQAEILDALAAERSVRRSSRNLVVAPTGTGKTVVAALDYQRLVRDHGDLSLLFVAHREQILTQSRRTFREVMADGSFGELLVGGERPQDHRHVFASIQSLSTGPVDYARDHFDMVIIDEFHHAEATTYQRLLDHLDPGWLLALTATPERSDGLDIRKWTDGRTAFDMRLWHALDRQLLTPFQYFGLADVADYSDVRWQAGAYNQGDLGKLYTGNDARTRQVLKAVEKVVGDPRGMKALAFCATVEHAHEMAEVFTAKGWPAVALDGTTPYEERRVAIGRLERGELCTIFTRDVFNEGVDIPTVDTILLLRPTESVTVHLQQLGRGLRRHADKDVCTVIDLVGQHRKEYRYDLRLRAMTGLPRRQLAQATAEGFPFLPSGCHIELDRQAEQWILDNIKQAVLASKPALRKELLLQVSTRPNRDAPPLAGFLCDAGIELEDVEKAGGWASLQRYSGLPVPAEGPEEPRMQRGVGRLTHVDDTRRIDTWMEWLRRDHPPTELSEAEARLAWMLLVSLWGTRQAPTSYATAWRGLWSAEAVRDELAQVLAITRDRIQRPTVPLPDPVVPLQLHATYGRDELLAGFGELAPGRTYAHREGVWFHEPSQTELLFVTLQKTEGDYSPETMYRDYAISRDLFHWETQNRTSVDSPVGRRYLDQLTNGVRILLAVRATKKDPWGSTAPYVLLGPARYVQHTGDRPIGITWRLDNPIPADLYEDLRVAAA